MRNIYINASIKYLSNIYEPKYTTNINMLLNVITFI